MDDQSGTFAHPLSSSFGRLSIPCLALMSEDDEYSRVPDPQMLFGKWGEAAQGHLTIRVIREANHAVTSDEARRQLCHEVTEYVKSIGR